MKKTTIILIALFLFALETFSQTKVAPIFSDNMVLQQDTIVNIWGTDKPLTKVKINPSWTNLKEVKTDEKGKWKTTLTTLKYKDPHTIEITGTTKLTLKNVVFGEVWLCSGQSNMEMPIKGFLGQPVLKSNEFLLHSKNKNIRLFNVKKKFSENPSENLENSWQEANAETVLNFSAVGYIFGKILNDQLNVPIGLISSSYGGTRVEAWTEKSVLHKSWENLGIEKEKKTQELNRNSPSVLYNAMIHPIIPYTMKGVIWYQGESNRKNAQNYHFLFSNMIDSWRKDWAIGDFPFYFVQIAPFEYKRSGESALLREAQLQTMLSVKNTGMAVTLDIGMEHFIHPFNKHDVSKRLALWALVKNYGFKGITYSGPIYKSMEIKEGKVLLSFDFAENGVTSFNKKLENFTIAGEDKIFYPATAEINRGKLSVFSNKVPNPVAVRYGWTNFLEGNLYNLSGLPASSFRTDNWDK